MTGRILVTGGTGRLGRLVVRGLLPRSDLVRILSRSPGPAGCVVGDLLSGRGLDAAFADVTAVVHCATSFGRQPDARMAATLVEAATRAGRPHVVLVSIVGIDRVPLGYYRAKLAAERVLETSGLPHSILRATQFHELMAAGLAALARSPVLPVPDLRFQPIAAGEVADRLADLATGAPVGRAPDVAGPQVLHCRDLAESVLRAMGRRRAVRSVRLPGRTFGAYRAGGHLAPDRAVGTVTFDEHLHRTMTDGEFP